MMPEASGDDRGYPGGAGVTAIDAEPAPARLVTVTNREPFRVVERENGRQVERTTGGLVAAMTPAMQSSKGVWISAGPDQQDVVELLGRGEIGFSWEPVHIPPEENEGFYEGLSNGALWPLYHSMPGLAVYDRRAWRNYVSANQRFADRIRAEVRPGDLVWVHDYQLSLVPGMLRRGGPLPEDARVGFFLHIPFPSYDLFRTLPWAKEILEGMLGASLIALHVPGYLQNFYDAVERVLGVHVDRPRDRIFWQGRYVHVRALPIGIDPGPFRERAGSPEVREMARQMREQVGCEKLVVGVDRLDYTKGIYERLVALETFFEKNPDQRGRVSLIQLAVPSRAGITEYQQLREQIEMQVGHINGLYARPGWTPVTYMCRSLPFDELVALYLAGDVALVTPLRDGMNLVAKEYVATQLGRDGVLILSELAGAAQQLGEALLVNPYDVEQIAEELKQALEMPEKDRSRRMRIMNDKVARWDVHHWVEAFLAEALYVD